MNNIVPFFFIPRIKCSHMCSGWMGISCLNAAIQYTSVNIVDSDEDEPSNATEDSDNSEKEITCNVNLNCFH